jgi:membrane protein implicated in regulation of membrane protease activity
VLLAKWALPSARRDVVDARYLMQGHPATVVRAIPAGGVGEIAYEVDGHRWTLAARGWDDSAVAAGEDVAIDRVEDGVAYVEQWAAVEARL